MRMSEPVRRLSLFLFVCMAQVAPFCHGQAFNIDLGGVPALREVRLPLPGRRERGTRSS